MNTKHDPAKIAVKDFWEQASCGEDLYLAGTEAADYAEQAKERYRLEPFILPFGKFSETRGRSVLEIGVGLGADHQQFAAAGANLSGIDLTARAIAHTQQRLKAFGFSSNLQVADAEHLPFPDESFDVVYSWGVLHHSPNTPRAIAEVHRVLRPGGAARIMIYHTWSLVGLMLWTRYALFCGRPWRSLASIYSQYLESPGTKAYSRSQARALFSQFSQVDLGICLTHGDLLTSGAGQRHEGGALRVARAIWPRWFLERFGQHLGLFLLITAVK